MKKLILVFFICISSWGPSEGRDRNLKELNIFIDGVKTTDLTKVINGLNSDSLKVAKKSETSTRKALRIYGERSRNGIMFLESIKKDKAK